VDDPYALDATYYDLVHADVPDDDIGLWLSFAGRTDRPVLEVGTGTGRIAIALAVAGADVVAVDPSSEMLARAGEASAAAGAKLDLREGTAASVPLPAEHFGLVLVPADVFLYCRDTADQLETLTALAAAMHFNATLIVDLPGPGAALDPSLNGQLLLAFAGADDAGDRLEVWHVREDDPAMQTRTLTVRYETITGEGCLRRQTTIHRLRYVYRYEMEHLLALTGLACTGVYGDYELGPLTADSERMIVVARRMGG
jgi:SAM-dependent methyltransferase